MRKALLLLISILIICTMFTMVSCENNVYLPGNDTWCVQDMYFQTFGEALAWLMGQGGGASRDLIQSDIPENQTIYLMRDVSLSENAGAIEVPASFAGSLCIDFRGHEYWFSSKIDKFFNIQGGDRIDIINGKTIISEDASSGSKAVIVNVNTVTIDDHLVDDRRPNPQAIEVGPEGVLVIKSASNNRTDSVLNGAFDIQAGGELRITGGVFRIDSIADPASMTGLVITGGVISNPHELSVYVDAAIAVGGHPENVQTNVIHDISDLWIVVDPEKHYKTCSGCTQHFEEGPHDYTDWVYDSNFNGQRQCTVCGRVEYMDHVHTLVFHPAKDPTCTVPGNIAYYGCEICGKTYLNAEGTIAADDVILTKPHTLTQHAAVAPICTEAGNIEYWTCEECHQYFTDAAGTTAVPSTAVVDPAKGHTWGEWTVVTPATCTETGLKQRVCANDETHIEQEVIPVTPHNLSVNYAVAPTCTSEGNIQCWTCEDCGKLFADAAGTIEITLEDAIIPALGHSMSDLIAEVPASCEATGTKAHYHCATCGKDFADADGKTEIEDLTIPATGHTWSEQWSSDSTHHWHACENCDAVKDKDEHTLGEWTYNPETGKMDNECTVCQKEFHQDHVHNESNLTYHPAVPHTCTENGNRDYYECSECGKKFVAVGTTFAVISDEDIIDPASHKLSKNNAVAATCESEGNIECWICEECGKYFSDAAGTIEITLEDAMIPALGHAYGDWIIDADPTCTVAGSKHRVCANDPEHVERAEIPVTGHHTDDAHHVAAKAATCTEAGNTEYWTCKDCGKYFTDAELTTEKPAEFFVIPALGHAKVHYEAVAATCTATGNVEYWHCTRCGKNYADEDCTIELETVTTQMVAHTPTTHEAVDATCVATGNSLYYECTVCGKYFSDEACEHEVEEDSWIIAIDPDNHIIEHVEAVAPTETAHGNTEYWHCTGCDKYFSDEDLEEEIDLEDTVVHNWSEAWTHDVIDNGHYHWHVCTVDGCEETTDPEACTVVYEHDTEGHEGKHHQICSVCKAEITEWTDHVWSEEIKHDDEKDLDYVECTCGARLYDELYEVTIGEITSTIGTDFPAGTMLVQEGENAFTVSYVPAAEEEPELSCRLYIDGVWSGENLEQQQDGTFTFQIQAEKTYRVMLIAENETGMTIYEKVIGV